MLCPHPLPSLYRWPRGPLGAIGGGGVPLGLLLPKGDLPTGESESKEDSYPSRAPPPPDFGQPPWGALPPKAKGGGAHIVLSGNWWNLPKAFRTFQDPPGPFSAIPGPSGMVSGHSGTFWNTSKTFRDHFWMFRYYLDRFRDDPGYGLACPMPCVCSLVVVGTSTD